MPVFLIDDGSSEPAKTTLANLGAALKTNDLGGGFHRFEHNQGKGDAVLQGFHMALSAGYSHAVQIDADGQHDIRSLPHLLERARSLPSALVTGTPIYDASIPKSRAIGRWITHFWVWIETLSFQIRDSMCGFRVYPLAAVAALLADHETIGRRMDFDTEIMVRLFWRGTPVIDIPVAVTYPADNTSNFDLWRDNWRISLMHTRLVFTMLRRLPWILKHRLATGKGHGGGRGSGQAGHWSWIAERGTSWGLHFCLYSYRLLGRRGFQVILMPIILYFYLTGGAQRRASRQFLSRSFAAKGWPGQPGFFDGYRHFHAFALRGLDTFIGWAKAMPAEAIQLGDVAALPAAIAEQRGALLIVAHLGNVDVARAMLDPETRARLLILVHTRHAENYNKVLREFEPEAGVNTFQVSELGPETAITLRERIEQGYWVVIAGDRTPVMSLGRTVEAQFLGQAAPFSAGPYILASLLECPVYLLFCLREGDHYRLSFEKFAERIHLPRAERRQRLQDYAGKYAVRLQEYALRDPYQWYNFFDFWAPANGQLKE